MSSERGLCVMTSLSSLGTPTWVRQTGHPELLSSGRELLVRRRRWMVEAGDVTTGLRGPKPDLRPGLVLWGIPRPAEIIMGSALLCILSFLSVILFHVESYLIKSQRRLT